MNRILLLLILVAFLTGCSSLDDVRFFHDETKCGDLWHFSGSDDELESVVKAFLKDRGVRVVRMQITHDAEQQSCEACTCTTGRRIKVWSIEEDAEILESLNFVRF